MQEPGFFEKRNQVEDPNPPEVPLRLGAGSLIQMNGESYKVARDVELFVHHLGSLTAAPEELNVSAEEVIPKDE